MADDARVVSMGRFQFERAAEDGQQTASEQASTSSKQEEEVVDGDADSIEEKETKGGGASKMSEFEPPQVLFNSSLKPAISVPLLFHYTPRFLL